MALAPPPDRLNTPLVSSNVWKKTGVHYYVYNLTLQYFIMYDLVY